MTQGSTTQPTMEEDVYIAYDGASYYFDRTRTGSNGQFRFDNLIVGNYKIYAFSDCVTGAGCFNGRVAVEILTAITVTGESVVLPDLTNVKL